MEPFFPDQLFQDWLSGAGVGDLTWDPSLGMGGCAFIKETGIIYVVDI